MGDVDLKEVKTWNINRFESQHPAFNLDDTAAHPRTVSFVDADFVAFHVDSLASLHQGLLDDSLDAFILVVPLVLVLLRLSINEGVLEIYELLVARLYALRRVDHLERKALVDESFVDQLVADRVHQLLEHTVR